MKKNLEEIIYEAVEAETGTCQRGNLRKDLFISRVEKRLVELKIPNVSDYVERLHSDTEEKKKFISLVTIHTTSWFREMPHYEFLKSVIQKRGETKEVFRLWSSACSTGQELWSSALILESHRRENPGFDYEILGSDIDEFSVNEAKRCIYQVGEKDDIPSEFTKLLMIGSGRTKGLMTLIPEIRKRVKFQVLSLKDLSPKNLNGSFDIIFCRNVLIYFDTQSIEGITNSLTSFLKNKGCLITGHSEPLGNMPKGLKKISNSVYQLTLADVVKISSSPRRLCGLVIDDSISVQKVLRKQLENHYDVLCAGSAAAADEILFKNKIDFITLDLSMPGENGTSWLKRFRNTNKTTPVVVVSDYGAEEADRIFGFLKEGAQDFVVKSTLGNVQSNKLLEILEGLCESKNLQSNKLPRLISQSLKFDVDVIVLGASTGGPQALMSCLRDLPKDLPPIVVVQHIYSNFAISFAKQMKEVTGLKKGELDDISTKLLPGHLYMPEGDYHLVFKKTKGPELCLEKTQTVSVHGQRPGVDELFNSLAANTNVKGVAFLLTGMGKDGAEGLLNLKRSEKFLTVTQDASSCVVYGMPRQAVELGAAMAEASPQEIRHFLVSLKTGARK